MVRTNPTVTRKAEETHRKSMMILHTQVEAGAGF
jgi:hypothetical protein